MAQAPAVEYDLTDFRLLCNAACQQNPVEFENTEVVASVLLDNLRLIGGTPRDREVANAVLNAHMENFQDIMDEQEELDERIAFGMSVTPKDTNDGSGEHEPIIRLPRRTAAAAPLAAADAAADAAAATNPYNNLIRFFNYLKNPENVQRLIFNMAILSAELGKICRGHAYVYNNILFFNPPVDEIRDASLFPKYSFNILCNQNSFLLPQLLVLGERGIGAILQNFVCNVFNNNLFREYVQRKVIRFKICNPTDTNKLWQVKICLFGNEFTLISIQIISMSLGFFTLQSIQNDVNPHLTVMQALLLSIYNKCLSRDFNCLCSLSELDIKLFGYIISQETLAVFANFIRHFFDNLNETQLNVKKQYFIMGLYNLASCYYHPNYTPETRAYELLFDQAPVGINLFNRSMYFIKRLNQAIYDGFTEQIRFAMGGGKLYSIFHKKLQELRINVSEDILREVIKAAADADFGCFYPEEGEGIAAGGIGASSCMAICMLLQLSLKELIDSLFAQVDAALLWRQSEIDIGNSCIGTPPTTLSSLRIVLKNILRFYLINGAQRGTPAADILIWLQTLQRIFDLGDMINIKAIISPYDYVMKGSLKLYIIHIFEAVHNYITLDPRIVAQFDAIANFLSKYCMITEEGFSSPIKGILDIFYTLFIIENFANRTFVTQKINKELKRVAICAQILRLHYLELPQNVVTQEILQILLQMILYGYGFDLLDQETFTQIMGTYVNFVTVLCNICLINPNFLYYSVVPSEQHTIAPIPAITQDTIDRLHHVTSIQHLFMHLLPDEPNILLPVITETIGQYTPVINALRTMGQSRLQGGQLSVPATTYLYLNKLYASCRDAENKKEGVVAITSAYQAYLWNHDNIDKIRRNEQNDDCHGMTQGVEGIIQRLLRNPNVFDALLQIIQGFANTNVLGMTASIQQINDNDILRNAVIIYPDHEQVTRLKIFLVFSWFITSVFGVKTKSKPSKIISLGRTYLQLLCENPPLQPTAPGVELQRVRQFILFGLQIIIPPAAVAAVAAAPVHVVIDNGIVPEIGVGLLVNLIDGNTNNRLCLAYNQANIRSAISKYIKMDIDMNINAARDAVAAAAAAAAATAAADAAAATAAADAAAAAAAASFNLANAQQAATRQASFDVRQVNGTNTISVNTESLVFNQEIFTQLIVRFSHLPRGNQYILGAAQYMRPIMRRICCLIDKREQITIEESITNINPFYPYNPKPHDVSKFTMLNQGMKNNWLQYLINKIFAVEGWSPQTVFDNMKLFVLLYNYIGPLIGGPVVFPNPPQGIIYLDVVGELINEHFTGCQTVNETLLRLSMTWESQEPRVIAAHEALVARALPRTSLEYTAIERNRRRDIAGSTSEGTGESPSEDRGASSIKGRAPTPIRVPSPSGAPSSSRVKDRPRNRSPGKHQGGGSPKASASKPKTRNNNRYSKNARTRKNNHNHKHKRKQHRNRKYKKTTNTKSNRRTKSQSKKNVTFKRRRR